MSQDQVVTVQIYNQTYRIASTTSAEVKFIKEAAALLDKKMREAAGTAGPRSPLDIAILAAMSIAQEVLEERDKKDDLIDHTDQKISDFTRRLEDETPSSNPPEDDLPPTARF